MRQKNLEKNPTFEGIDFHYFGMYNQAISEFWKEFILALLILRASPDHFLTFLQNDTKAPLLFKNSSSSIVAPNKFF